MKRIAVITVGITHSGKTTFAKSLERHLPDSVVVDRDNLAEFINAHYSVLVPKHGTNTLKNVLTRAIVDYVINQTHLHIIQCSANRARQGRLDLLQRVHQKGLISVIVNFEIPDRILRERIAASKRNTSVIRTRSNFEEVLDMQQTDSDGATPTEGEAHHLFAITHGGEVQSVIEGIMKIAQS